MLFLKYGYFFHCYYNFKVPDAFNEKNPLLTSYLFITEDLFI